MATERELKTQQEDRLFDIFLMQRVINERNELNPAVFLSMMGEKAQSGMTAEEIDAVRERVSRAYTSLTSN